MKAELGWSLERQARGCSAERGLSWVSLAAPRGSDVEWALYDRQKIQLPFQIGEMDQRVLGAMAPKTGRGGQEEREAGFCRLAHPPRSRVNGACRRGDGSLRAARRVRWVHYALLSLGVGYDLSSRFLPMDVRLPISAPLPRPDPCCRRCKS
jgi:hypothetical protein